MKSLIDKTEFFENLENWGASIVRVADTARLSGIDTEPSDLLSDFHRAVSIAVCLSDPIMNMIDKQPTPLYSSHYCRVNALLDDLAIRATNFFAVEFRSSSSHSCEPNTRFRKMYIIYITQGRCISRGDRLAR